MGVPHGQELLVVLPRVGEVGEGLRVEEQDVRVVLGVAHEERVARGDRVVDARVVGVEVRALVELSAELGLLARGVVRGRQRDEREVGQHARVDGRPRGQEGAAPRGQARHRLHVGEPELLAQPLVGEEEERLVLHQRAAGGEAELVAAEGRLPGVEEVPGVQRVVAEVLEGGAVEHVAAGAGDDVEDAARRAPVLRAVGVGQEGELLDGLDPAHQALRAGRVAAQRVQDVGAVEHVGVLRGARAVHGDLGPLAGQDVALVGACLGRARLQQDELREVAAVEGQGLDLLLRDERAVGRAARLHAQPGPGRRDLDALRHRPRREDDVGLRVLADAEVREQPRGPEAGRLRGHLVRADLQLAEGVAAVVVAHRLAGVVGGKMAHGDRHPRHRRARAVADDTREVRALALRERAVGEEGQAGGRHGQRDECALHGNPPGEASRRASACVGGGKFLDTGTAGE